MYMRISINLKLKCLTLGWCAALAALLSGCGSSDTGTLELVTQQGRTVTVTAVNDHIVRVTNTAEGERPSLTQAATLATQPFKGKITQEGDVAAMTLESGLRVEVNRATGVVRFVGDDGQVLVTDTSERSATDSTHTVTITANGGGAFYGAGERGYHYKLNGDTLLMYNQQNYGYTDGEKRIDHMGISVPMFISSEGYGVLFDDHAAAIMTLTDPIEYTSEASDPISYFFIYGEGSIAGVTEQFVDLTGHQELPPFWSLGYITSKYGYRTEAETRGVIDTLRQMGYPVDGLVLDLYWYGQETDMGRWDWMPSQWPQPEQMLADLDSLGVHVTLITQPYVNKQGAIDNYNTLKEGGMLVVDSAGQNHDVPLWVGESGMLDVSNPKTRQWMADRYRALTRQGVGGWWGDLGDLESHPATVRHSNGMTARQYHNVYGNDWSKIIYDMYQQDFPDTRLMSLMRGGTTGLQRYSVMPWSTDVSRSWGGLQPQVKIMLSSGLSGLGYMSHDVGGFAITDQLRDPELYVRWLQLGTFSPILRTHAQQLPEPYHYPEYADLILSLVKERYRWLPYNYTLAYENTAHGTPLVRPLNYRDSHNEALADVTDQYLWGDNVMIAPVMQQGATEREVVIPPGLWIDYNNPAQTFEGPATITYPAPLSVLPMFVRAGAFIPQARYAMQNVRDYDASRYTVLYYPRGKDVSLDYVLYEDDRQSTRSLQDGQYALIKFEGECDDDEIEVEVKLKGSYQGMPAEKHISMILPGMQPDVFKSVTVDGKPASCTEGAEGACIDFTVSAGSPAKIKIKL